LDKDSSEFDIPFTSQEIETACSGQLHPEAVHGLHLFNAGEYFEAHEALETAWRDEPGFIRDLYRGILQVGVGYSHIQRGNYRGARKMFQRCHQCLSPFPAECRGINLDRLRKDYRAVEQLLIRLGPGGITQIDQSNFKPISFSQEVS
jgi:uncharacterized protein